MATEKREGLEVVAWRWPTGDGRRYAFTAGDDTPPSEDLGVQAMVLLSDAQAEVARAREEGRVRGLDQALEAIIRMEDSPRGSNAMYHACKMAVAALLPSPPPEGGPDAD